MNRRLTRKSHRLEGYDYSQNGIYFLTVCALDQEYLFGEIVGGGALDAPSPKLNECGQAVEQWLLNCKVYYHDLTILNYVIMPNHIHLLVSLYCGPSGAPAPTPANQRIPLFLSALKRMTSQVCGRPLWQRDYHDHIVRNEQDYLRIWQYIQNNPARWKEDRFYNDPGPAL